MAAEAVAVSIRKVGKRFGNVAALDDVSLDIRRGEFFSLLGPSGCGKTTLLRSIGGFEAPTEGDILIEGRSVLHLAPYERPTNMIFQHLALFPHLGVRENVGFGLRMKGADRAASARRVEEALRLVRLEDYGERRVDQLSGGQRQRVAMARALVNDPAVLLLDEPLGALDLQLRLQMQEELRRLQRQLGATFVFVTHDQGEAMAMSDRIAVMNAGRLQQVGTPAEIYERPANRFVATFVGHANMIEARLTGRAAEGLAEAEGPAGLRLRGIAPPHGATDGGVLAVLRYEKLRILPHGADGEGIGATVVEKTYMGSSLRFACRTGAGATMTADTPNAMPQRDIGEGDMVRLAWSPEDVVLLTD
ncbi:spermidine/putrescine ABC transporter ATP-binding protein [Falsiroseomonas bella]|uniref:Spermidine/putrescine ABC transporter ATP-binding protein n=1 Tax=Falsiroseomonas bella TaxID=2184016 RepID=A0A317FL76_9PROT|nr:ABC transporter ATP-binding protein [Falsiroseomonas bella]PWS38719.1 spermidine/putrescine ABC transporter ATP-binding protein [Falsiroseomonas bella]